MIYECSNCKQQRNFQAQKCNNCGFTGYIAIMDETKSGSQEANPTPKHSHYFREWKGEKLDFYFIMTLFGITDPCLTHALKKLMFAGVRGAKGEEKDMNEAIDSIRRRLELMKSFGSQQGDDGFCDNSRLLDQDSESSSFKTKTDGPTPEPWSKQPY